jgi:sugar lactone lactonase YvrE
VGEAEVGEEVGGGYVDGGVVGCAGGAVGEGLADGARVDAAGSGWVGELGFAGEGVLVEPVEEGRVAEEAEVGVLGGV